MAKFITPTKDEIFDLFMRWERRWLHENKFYKGSPAWDESRELRLKVARYKRSLKANKHKV